MYQPADTEYRYPRIVSAGRSDRPHKNPRRRPYKGSEKEAESTRSYAKWSRRDGRLGKRTKNKREERARRAARDADVSELMRSALIVGNFTLVE